MPVSKPSLGSGMLGNIETEKVAIVVGMILAFFVPMLVLDGSPTPTALGLPVWFLWILVAVILEYALVYRLGSHYLDSTSGGE